MMNRRKMLCSLVNLMLTSLALALEAKATGGGGVKDDHHHYTNISRPPQSLHHHHIIDNNQPTKEAASFVQGACSQSHYHNHHPTTFLHAPKELICDAYGICKHKISDAIGRAKDKISEKETALFDAVGNAKETVYNTAHDVHQQTKQSFDKAKETGQTLKDHVVRNVSEAKGYAVKHGATNYIVGWMETLMRVANLVGFATAYGMNVWVTLISSYLMPRKAFIYFKAMAFSIGIALLGHVLAHRNRLLLNMPEIFQACNLLASLFTVSINSLCLGPRAAKLRSERMKIEKEEGTIEEHHHDPPKEPPNTTTTTTTTREGVERDAAAVRSRIMKLNEKLSRFNSYSSILNILTLILLTSHLLYFATNHVCTHQ